MAGVQLAYTTQGVGIYVVKRSASAPEGCAHWGCGFAAPGAISVWILAVGPRNNDIARSAA